MESGTLRLRPYSKKRSMTVEQVFEEHQKGRQRVPLKYDKPTGRGRLQRAAQRQWNRRTVNCEPRRLGRRKDEAPTGGIDELAAHIRVATHGGLWRKAARRAPMDGCKEGKGARGDGTIEKGRIFSIDGCGWGQKRPAPPGEPK
jgi:hypothetical protein